jgi:sulfur relay (sulfurtransferase) DsrC/TusE family protein
MNANLDNIAEELFGKIRTRFPKIDMGDEEGKVIENNEQVKKARFFDFDYIKEGVSLGSVSIKLSEDDGLTVMYSNDIAEGQPQNIVNEWYGFLKSLREFARRRLLNFDTRDLVKSNLDKRDYNFLAKNSGEGQMTESKLRGTNRTSFQDVGEAKIIVKHSQNVNYDNPAGRTLHIESIFIENANGERFLYPHKHLNGARAMAQHVAHGGKPYDDIGQHVIGLSEELSKLRFFKGYVSRQDQISEAMGSVTDKVIERIDQVKKEIHQLQSATHYKSFVESFTQSEAQQIPEDTVNDWVDKLTIRNFNEALKDVFPYIYKLVGENSSVRELTADDLLGEDSDEKCDDCHKPVDDCECDDHDHDAHGKKIKEFAEFEYTLENILSEDDGIASADEEVKSAALEKLNQFLSTNPTAGTDGTNAIMSLKDIIKDSKFIGVLKSLPAETELSPVIKGYLETEHPELVDQVTFPEEGSAPAEPAPAPAEPAAAEAPPAAPAAPEQGAAMPAEQPVAAESSDDAPFDGGRPVSDKKDKFGNTVKKRAQHSAKQGLVAAIEKARKAGMKSEDIIEVGGQQMSLSELAERAGITLRPHPKEIVEFIKSFYDREHGTFPKGETGVLIATEKKFGESATPIAHRVIETLSQISETHRMRKLAGMRPDNMAFESVTYESIMLSEAPAADPAAYDNFVTANPGTTVTPAQFAAKSKNAPASNAATLKQAQATAAQGTTGATGPATQGGGAGRGGQGGPTAAQLAAQTGQAAQPKKAPDEKLRARQKELIAAGAQIKADGIAGPATTKAEAEFGGKTGQATMAPGPATGSQAPTANADNEKAKVGIAAGAPAAPATAAAEPALDPNRPMPGQAVSPYASQARVAGGANDVGTLPASTPNPADPTAAANPMAGVKPTTSGYSNSGGNTGGAGPSWGGQGGNQTTAAAAPPANQAAQPAAAPAAAPLSTVQPDVKAAGGAIKSGSGETWKSSSDLQAAWKNLEPMNRSKPYPGDAVAQQQVDADNAKRTNNLNAVKGVWNKLTGAKTQESVSFANDELNRIVSLVRHR